METNTTNTKEQIIFALTKNNPNQNRTYTDKISGIEFQINVPINLSEIIRSLKQSDEFYRKYQSIVIDGKTYSLEREVVDMCYRCSEYVVSPKLEISDWLYLSVVRGDLVIALNAEISDIIFTSVNDISQVPLAGSNTLSLSTNLP